MENITYAITYTDIEKAFTNWSVNYKENPEIFLGELPTGDSIAYGDSSASYFLELLKEIWATNDTTN